MTTQLPSKELVETWLIKNVGTRCREEYSGMCSLCSIWKMFDETTWPTPEPRPDPSTCPHNAAAITCFDCGIVLCEPRNPDRATQPPVPDLQMAMALISEVDCHLANAKWDKDATGRRKLHQAYVLIAGATPTKGEG
jgi:hypothetical protein